MPGSSAFSFLRTLCSLRWLAIAGQAATILLASSLLRLDLPLEPLWTGVGVLIGFNLYAILRLRHSRDLSHVTAFAHLLVDMAVLAWMVGWSGGIGNPFGMMFLILTALAALALPRNWALAAAVAGISGYVLAALFGRPLQGGIDAHTLLLWGLGANFLISVVVVLVFSTRMAADLRARERELARLRERFTRNEGIVALATHAAAMAHELNTPLATMTLLADEISAEVKDPDLRADVATLSQLLALCRERIRNLAVPTAVDLVRVVGQWRLIRPTIDLQRSGSLPSSLRVDPAIAHLLQALLNNAADAGEAAGAPRVDLHLEYGYGALRGEVRDYGRGFDPDRTLLPATSLFNSGKPGGLGVGLALSHATVEQLGGEMTMTAAEDGAPASVSICLSAHPGPDYESYRPWPADRRRRAVCAHLATQPVAPGPETRTATGIAEALRVAEEIRPAFALVDLRLGEDSGLTLIRPSRCAPTCGSCWSPATPAWPRRSRRSSAAPTTTCQAGHRPHDPAHPGPGEAGKRRDRGHHDPAAPAGGEHIHQALHETGATSRPPPACWACTGAPCSASWPRNRGRNAKCCWIDLCRCDISSHPPTAATAAPLPGKTLNPAIWGWRHAGQCDHSSQA